jgi:hypothetical protein
LSNNSPNKIINYVEFNKENLEVDIFGKELVNRRREIPNDYLVSNAWIFENAAIKQIIDKIKSNGNIISDIQDIKINRGITTGFDDAFIISNDDYNKFINENIKNKDILKPLLKGKDIKRYFIENSGVWLLNSHNGLKNKLNRIDLKADYPSLYNYVIDINNNNEGKVENRSDKGEHWTNLRSCAFLDEFEKEKIVWGLISGNWSFALDINHNFLTSASYFLTSSSISVKFLLGVLNGKTVKFYFENTGEMTAGGAYVLKKTSIEKIIIPNNHIAYQQPIIDLVDSITRLNKELQEASGKFTRNLVREFSLATLPGKLQNWYTLTFAEFLKELSKLKVTLSLSQKAEWEEYFTKEQAAAQALQNQIATTDKAIDQMVYKLYELTPEEIAIVEGA